MQNTLLSNFNVSLRAAKNLGTFSTTCMQGDALKVFNQYAALNAVDSAAYPEMTHITSQCGEFLLSLFNADERGNYHYFPTSGSSEAVFVSLLLMKHHWQLKNKNIEKPNIILSPTAHVAFHVAAKSLDIDINLLDYKDTIDVTAIHNYINKNTMALICSMGNTITLQMEEVEKVNALLGRHFKNTGDFIPIHVDAASGGFVAPFFYPQLIWDFRLEHVQAINVSSHKFGLVYPSLGWLCIHNDYYLSDLSHENSYLGKKIKRTVVQFSQPASQLAAQHYNIHTLGFSGYQNIVHELFSKVSLLSEAFKKMDFFNLVTPSSQPAVPGIIFTFKDNKQDKMIELSRYLNQRYWHLPTFELAHLGNKTAARIIVRNGLSEQLIDELVLDINAFLHPSTQIIKKS
jgi:glutamate decarboxylase